MKTRIEITLKPKADKQKKRKSPPRPLIRTGSSPDVLSRRKGGFIRFYDMGQVSNGSGGYLDTNFQITTAPIPSGNAQNAAPLTVTDYDNRDAPLLAAPTGQWMSRFRRIDKGTVSVKYNINAQFGAFDDALDNLSQWTGNGLKVEQADLDTGLLVGGAANNPFFDIVKLLNGETNQKITATPAYADSAVAFTPSPRMDVFFPPVLVFMRGTAINSVLDDLYHFGDLNLTFPRRFIVNTSDDYQGGSGVTDPSGSPPSTDEFDAQTIAAIANWKTVVSGREYYYDSGTLTWSAGPFPPAAPRRGGIGVAERTQYTGTDLLNGVLLAVVKKGSSFYYFWTDGF